MKIQKNISMIFMIFIFVMKINAMNVWVIGDEVKINPETGKAFEENTIIGLDNYKTSNWIWNKATNTITVYGARNEVVAFQIIIERENSEIINGVNVSIDNLIGTNGSIDKSNIELFREWYVYVKEKSNWYPEPLIPLTASKYGAPFNIPSSDFYMSDNITKLTNQQNQAIWCDIFIPKNTREGEYNGVIHITSSTGQSKDINLVVKVWNFALPDQTHSGMEFMTGAGSPTIYEYQLAHKHRITIGHYQNPVSSDTSTGKVNWNIYLSDTSVNKKIVTGSAFTNGFGAGVPIRHWMLPFNVRMNRKEGPNNGPIGRTFPVNVGVSGDWSVDKPFPDTYKNCAKSLMQDIDSYFTTNFPTVKLTDYPSGFDEPRFQSSVHGVPYYQNLAARMKEFGQIFEDAVGDKIKYRVDFSNGFNNCVIDLNKDGKIENPACNEVINFFRDENKENKNVIDIWGRSGYSHSGPLKKENVILYSYGCYDTIDDAELNFRINQWNLWKYKIEVSATWIYKPQETGINGFRNVHYYEGGNEAGIWHFMFDGGHIGITGIDTKIAGMRMKAMRRGLQDYEYLWLLKEKGQDMQANALVDTMIKKTNPQEWFNAVKQMGESLITAIDKSAFDLKKSKNLSYPNPFNPECYIAIEAVSGQQSAVSKIKIYNILGQTVRELNVNNGSSSVYWDGRDNFGKELSSGMYFYEMLANNKVQNCRKMLMLK